MHLFPRKKRDTHNAFNNLSFLIMFFLFKFPLSIFLHIFLANYTPSDMPELLCNLRDKYGDIVKLKTGTSSMVYVFHPDYAKTVFQAQYKEHAKTQMKLPETFFKRNNIPKGVVLL